MHDQSYQRHARLTGFCASARANVRALELSSPRALEPSHSKTTRALELLHSSTRVLELEKYSHTTRMTSANHSREFFHSHISSRCRVHCVCACKHTCTCMYTCTCIYTCTYTCTRTCTCMCTTHSVVWRSYYSHECTNSLCLLPLYITDST